MTRPLRGLLAAAAAVTGGAVTHRQQDDAQTEQGEDEMVYTRIARKTCMINSIKGTPDYMVKHMQEGSWGMKAYNTDKFMSSTVYQNEADGRCVLAFSGYHGYYAGYGRAVVSLLTPLTTWKLCGNQMYAPYVRLMRHHTSLANWTKIANFLGGEGTTCKGDLLVAAESMGGSVAEILAACANSGDIRLLQNESLPSFQVQALYTYGAPAASIKPITNPLRDDGCFLGKRVYAEKDPIAYFGGYVKDLKHSKMDSIEIFMRKEGPTFKVTPCRSVVRDGKQQAAPPLVTNLTSFEWTKRDGAHDITTYEKQLKYFQAAGYGRMVAIDLVEPASNEYVNLMQRRRPAGHASVALATAEPNEARQAQ